MNFYMKEKELISDYTIHLNNMNLKGSSIYNEISKVINHVSTVLIAADPEIDKDMIIFDVNFPKMTVFQIDKISDKNDLEIEKLDLEKLMLEKNDEKTRLKIDKIEEKINTIKSQITISLREELDDTDDVIITFFKKKHVKLMKKLYNTSSATERACSRCCGGKDYESL